MTDKQMEALAGTKIGAKVQMILVGETLYRRIDGGWEAYPDD